MKYPVIVREEPSGEYSAEPIGLTELRVSAPTKAEALSRVAAALRSGPLPDGVELVDVEGRPEENPWLAFAGRSANDPNWDEYVEELRRIREADPRE